ncbi:hypothetical protein CDG81_21945 [Actinopolyspora erythraea]|uniref:Uncharacterized protein n=1 Tax=Actinopolyspora erythraea TaxID=414996 RepID=A0A099DBP6_9ACTN|nr:hypothetical protein [Actinopolyspora erythraea]ASU80494.1 hypothetical protein CDG81_21945 [Actinopolyspora erythraea]KGI82835.1 hypothetical protein IL38_02910 [Actinopolyspora erythraea]
MAQHVQPRSLLLGLFRPRSAGRSPQTEDQPEPKPGVRAGAGVREFSPTARRFREGVVWAVLACGMLAAGMVMFHAVNTLGP